MKYAHAVFFDISKVFDTASTSPKFLSETMERLGLDKFLLKWIHHRLQFVGVNGCNSHPLPAISGVPQGSVLGPLLFISYINDVTTVVSSGSDLNLFADDSVLYRVIKDPTDFDHLQLDINSAYQGSICNLMLVSADKC